MAQQHISPDPQSPLLAGPSISVTVTPSPLSEDLRQGAAAAAPPLARRRPQLQPAAATGAPPPTVVTACSAAAVMSQQCHCGGGGGGCWWRLVSRRAALVLGVGESELEAKGVGVGRGGGWRPEQSFYVGNKILVTRDLKCFFSSMSVGSGFSSQVTMKVKLVWL